MVKSGKNFLNAKKAFEGKHDLSIDEAVNLVKNNASAKFDETIDIAINLGELYGYSIRKLFAANVNVDNAPDNVAEVKSLLEPIAEAWENMDLSKPRELIAV